jgi:hypothetical protein
LQSKGIDPTAVEKRVERKASVVRLTSEFGFRGLDLINGCVTFGFVDVAVCVLGWICYLVLVLSLWLSWHHFLPLWGARFVIRWSRWCCPLEWLYLRGLILDADALSSWMLCE